MLTFAQEGLGHDCCHACAGQYQGLKDIGQLHVGQEVSSRSWKIG